MSAKVLNTSILTGLHLTVDGLCSCCMFMLLAVVGNEHSTSLFVLYNVLAFMNQPFFGWWVDISQKRNAFFCTSIALLLVGAALSAISVTWLNEACIYLGTTFLGLGNAIFHVFGGKSVAIRSRNDMRHLGVFVSTGAVGLTIGKHCSSFIALAVIASFMLMLAYLLLKNCHRDASYRYDTYNPAIRHGSLGVFFIVFILFLVFIRSFIGPLICPIGMDVVTYLIIADVIAFFGKSLGGFLGMWFGIWNTLTCMFLLSGICFLLSFTHISFNLLAVLFINLTTPLTLCLANCQMPHREGLSFGLLAAVLVPGNALAVYLSGSAVTYQWLFALVATIVIEMGVLLAIRERRWQVLAMSVVMNILTNVPLNLYFIAHPQFLDSIPTQMAFEAGVLIVESLLFFLVLRNMRKAFTYAFLCNATSYLVGLLFTALI